MSESNYTVNYDTDKKQYEVLDPNGKCVEQGYGASKTEAVAAGNRKLRESGVQPSGKTHETKFPSSPLGWGRRSR